MTPPPKWHLARVGLLTCLLGLGMGWMMFSSPKSSRIRVPGATLVKVECPGFKAEKAGSTIGVESKGPCTIEATLQNGHTAEGQVRVTLPGTQTCRSSGELLRCDSSVP